jgi:hypothetical protein
LQTLLELVNNVWNIRINIEAASVAINFSPEIPEGEFADRLAKSIETGLPPA